MKPHAGIWLFAAWFGAGTAFGQIAIPTEADWVDHGLVIDASPLSQGWDAIFEGKTPCSVVQKDGVMYLYYVGADNYISQKDNIGPSHRSIGVATSTDGVHWTKYAANPVITFSSSGNPEEGAVSGGVFLDTNGDFIAYYGANISSSPTSPYVNADTRVARSTDGFNFSGSSIVVNHADPGVYGYGDELHASMGYTSGGIYYAFYVPNGVPQKGQLAASWGSSYDNLTNNGPVTSGGSTILARRPGSIVPIGNDTLAFFNSHTAPITVRTAAANDPIHLSGPVQTYSNLPGFGRVVHLDQDRQTWFMYYNQWSYMGMLTAPMGTPDSTGPAAPAAASAAALSYKEVQLNWDPASDPETGVLHYNIYRDGLTVGTTRDLAFRDSGTQELTAHNYEIRPVNLHGTEGAGAPATLTTPADFTPPAVHIAAASGNAAVVEVLFDEAMDAATAADPSNYALSHGAGVLGASLGPNGRTVTLTTTAQQDGVLYTLQVNGVRDTAAAANIGSPTWQYTYSDVGGLVAYYRLDGGSPGASDDTSGYGQHGQVHGNPVAMGSGRGGALRFDGASDYVEIDDTNVLDQTFAGSFTVAAWVKPDDVPPWTTASDRAYAVFTSPNMSMEYDTNRKFFVRLKTSDGQVSILTTDTFVPDVWHHLATVVDGDNGLLFLYVDGQLVGAAPTSFTGQVTPPPAEADEVAWMGQYYAQYRIGVNDPLFDYEMNYFKGGIDDLRVFNRALDAGEIAAVIPEPATALMLILGAATLLAPRPRRSH